MRKAKIKPLGKSMSIQEFDYNNKLKGKELAKEYKDIKPAKFDLK